jgi:hypothetical protein
VRKPEQGTAPKLFYIEGNDVVMHPTATERTPESFMWPEWTCLREQQEPADETAKSQIRRRGNDDPYPANPGATMERSDPVRARADG